MGDIRTQWVFEGVADLRAVTGALRKLESEWQSTRQRIASAPISTSGPTTYRSRWSDEFGTGGKVITELQAVRNAAGEIERAWANLTYKTKDGITQSIRVPLQEAKRELNETYTVMEQIGNLPPWKSLERDRAVLGDIEATAERIYSKTGALTSRVTTERDLSDPRNPRVTVDRWQAPPLPTADTAAEWITDATGRWQKYQDVVTTVGDVTTKIHAEFDRGGKVIGGYSDTLTKTEQGTSRVIERMNAEEEAVRKSTSQWQRHLTWITQGIVLWEAIGAIRNTVREWYEVQMTLDRELAMFNIAMKDGNANATEYLDTITRIATTMNVPLTEVAPAATVAYRTGTEDLLPYAAGISRISGADMSDTLREIIALHKQFPDERIVDLMDAYVTAWQDSTLGASEFFGMLERARGFSSTFNMDFQTTVDLIAQAAAISGESGGVVERFVSKFAGLYEAGNPLREMFEEMVGYSTVQYTAGGQAVNRPLDQLIADMQRLSDAQQQLLSEQIPNELGQPYRDWFQPIVDGFHSSTTEAGAFGRAMDGISESSTDAIASIKTEWQAFLKALGDTGPIEKAARALTDLLERARENLENPSSMPEPYRRALQEQNQRIDSLPYWLKGLFGLDQYGAYGMVPQSALQLPSPYFAEPNLGRRPHPRVSTPTSIAPPAAPQTLSDYPPFKMPQDAGIFTLPEGVDFVKFLYEMSAADLELGQFAESAHTTIEPMREFSIIMDSTGQFVGTAAAGLADFNMILARIPDIIPRSFSDMTPEAWAMTNQMYYSMLARYKQADVPVGERETYINMQTGTEAVGKFTDVWGHASDVVQEYLSWKERENNAVKRAAQQWESVLTSLPGVSTATPVTAYDLYGLSPLGMYQDKFDEPVRRMRQDVQDVIAGRSPEYGAINQPWFASIFDPIRGAGLGGDQLKQAMMGGQAMAEEKWYGLTLPPEAYASQMGMVGPMLDEYMQGQANRKANIEALRQAGLAAGYSPSTVEGFIEHEAMPPGLKAIMGDMTSEEFEAEVDKLGTGAGSAFNEGIVKELTDKPWVEDVVRNWQLAVVSDANTTMLVGLGNSMGSRVQKGFVDEMADELVPKVVAAILERMEEDGEI